MSDPHTERSKFGPKLSEVQRLNAAAAVLAGHSKALVAKEFGVTQQAIHNLSKSLLIPGEIDIRSRLTALNATAATAIERSMLDTEDVHKAANTGVQHLKGMGVYAADAQVSVAIVNQVAALPEDWQSRYVSNTLTVSPDDTEARHPVAENPES